MAGMDFKRDYFLFPPHRKGVLPGEVYEPPKPLLSQPPNFDYNEFAQVSIPSERRLRRLFPHSPEWRTRLGDSVAESQLLYTYQQWAVTMCIEEERRTKTDYARWKFYQDLHWEIETDLYQKELGKKDTKDDKKDKDDPMEILKEAVRDGVISQVDKWEFHYLDDDGGTTDIEKRIGRDDWSLLRITNAEVRGKYRHLASPKFWRLVRGIVRNCSCHVHEADEEDENITTTELSLAKEDERWLRRQHLLDVVLSNGSRVFLTAVVLLIVFALAFDWRFGLWIALTTAFWEYFIG